MGITPSRLVAALSFIMDPTEVEISMADMLDIGREIWRVSQGSRYELWSDFAKARGISGQLAEAKWRAYLAEPDGPDVIERLAREQGWDGGFDREAGTEDEPGDLWGDMVLGTCADYATEHVISPPRSPIGIGSLDMELGGGLASGTYTAIGGEGRQYFCDGSNYPPPEEHYDAELGWGRVCISPAAHALTDRFRVEMEICDN